MKKWIKRLLLLCLDRLCSHKWKRTFQSAHLSMWDKSGTIEAGERCSKCKKERNVVIVKGAKGQVLRKVVL